MKIYKDFSVIKKKDYNDEPILFFNFDNTSTYIKLYKGSLNYLIDIAEENGRSVRNVSEKIITNYVYKENKDKIKDLLTTVKIINEKDRSNFDKSYYKLKKYFDVVANNREYFKSIYKFLRG